MPVRGFRLACVFWGSGFGLRIKYVLVCHSKSQDKDTRNLSMAFVALNAVFSNFAGALVLSFGTSVGI